MPEGPEVRIIVDQLNKTLNDCTLKEFKINSGRYSKKAPDNYLDFTNSLPLKIKKVNCKGKFIWFELDKGWQIWNTLGMSGGWKSKQEKHGHISFICDKLTIFFDDYRNFGTFKFINDQKLLDKKLKELGVDVLGNEYSLETVKKIFKEKRLQDKTIVVILMNQKKFCGIGNYLKSEILYACKISPYRLVSDLSDKDIENIYKYSKSIIVESYKKGGASVRDFSNLDNEKGKYTDNLKVYFKKQDPEGYKVKKEETKDKRTTHWVPELQI
jgi:DNA-formamidopyrimidine glycosylase